MYTDTHALFSPSLVMFEQVYVTDVVPKTFYNDSMKSYFVSVTVCMHVVSQPSEPLKVNVVAKTDTEHNEFDVTGVSQCSSNVYVALALASSRM